MAIKRTGKSKTKSVKPISVSDIVQHAFTMSTNPHLLFNQTKAFVFLIFSVLLLTGAAFLLGGVLFLLAYATNNFLLMFLVVFVVTLLWFVGLNIATVFFNGLRFHLAMQHATHKSLDFHLAWKLSAARWHDAFWTQVVLDGFLLVGLGLLIGLALLLGSFNLVVGFTAAGIGILLLIVSFIYIQPYLFLIFPVAYFESLTPRNVFLRTVQYIKPQFWHVFALVVIFALVSWIIGGSVSQATMGMFLQMAAMHPVIVVLGLFLLVFIHVALNVFISTFGTSIQTQLYLRVGNLKEQNIFVSRDPLAKHLSRMARNHPSHSPYYPVKWKSPSKKRK